jgi:hypothetical protein
MPSTSRPPNASTSVVPPDPTLVTATINRLRAEHDATDSPTVHAILLHEIGVLEELLGDEAAAARDQLGAVNADPEFREPLERLITIIEHRQSYKNLGKLLERLVRVADAPEERERALLMRAAFQLDHEDDLDGAHQTLEEAVAERPEDAAGWLALEIVAGKLADSALRARSLGARARLAQHPTWRALLLVDLASLQVEQGDLEAAIASLDEAVGQKSEATFLAWAALEELGRVEERDDVLARSLEGQAELLLQATEDPVQGDALGVPHYRRNTAFIADAWLRAAEAERRAGNLTGATSLLDQALERLPSEPVLLHARLNAAEATGDIASAAQIARAALERGAVGAPAAALWLRVAEAAAAEGDGQGALHAVDQALEQDPGSIPARALELDLLTGGHDPQAVATALEAAAAELPTDEAKARLYLLAADAWARLSEDVQGAKAALSQAGMFGAAPGVVARVARLLAAFIGDAGWYEESTRRLIAAGATDSEQRSLSFELARARLLRGQIQAADNALRAMTKAPGGAWLAEVLRAYALELVPESDQVEAPTHSMPPPPADEAPPLLELARGEDDPALAAAERTVAALRALREGKTQFALTELTELHRGDTKDAVTSAALAGLARQSDEPSRAAEVLRATAQSSDDPLLSAAFGLEAGILEWQAGDRSAAVDSFSRAASFAPTAGGPMLAWALRATEPDNMEARRRVLEASADDGEPGLVALERFALEVGSGGDPDEALTALEALGGEPGDLQAAGTLARALWAPPEAQDNTARVTALETLAEGPPAARAVALSSLHRLRIEDLRSSAPDLVALERSAASWAEADSDAPAALEWLAATIALGDVEKEIEARRELARRLDGDLAAPLDAGASLIAALSGHDNEPLVDSDDPAAELVNLELAPPGSDPRRRAAALNYVSDTLGEESIALARVLAGYNQLAALDAEGALETFRAAVEVYPQEVIGWEGLRAAAQALGERTVVAEACAALGDAVSDDAQGSELWEQAGLILIDELNDTERGEFALGRAVERDIGRFAAFDRLFRMVRAKKDGPRLLELIAARLEVAEDPQEIAKLFWERARVMRAAGDREGALAALENVTMLESDHVGALALSGEVYITTGRFAEAAHNLARLATLDEAPTQQRLMSGVAAVDLYEKKLGKPEEALKVLGNLYRSGLSTLPVRERLARSAAAAGMWQQATEVLEELMMERDTAEGRVEAARLAMAIYRDRLKDPAGARKAVEKLLSEVPYDGEALDLLLDGALAHDVARPLLERGSEALIEQLVVEPMDAAGVERLARLARFLENPPLRQAALGTLVALGEGSSAIDRELEVLDQRVPRLPQIVIDESALPDLCDPDDRGTLPALMRELAPTFAEALGPGLTALDVSKKDRVDPRSGLPVRNEVAAWAGALGLGDFELYLSRNEPQAIYGVATEPPSVVIGSAVAAPLSPLHRQAVAREMFALKRGVTILRHRDPADIAALVVAACSLGGQALQAPHYALLEEFQRLLGKEMSRKVKRVLPELATAVASSGRDVPSWVSAATSSLDRLAAIAAGDVSYVLAATSGQRGHIGASVEARERARRLLSFVLSPTYLALRERLGMGVR